MTKTKLIEERQREWVPDISYDLDGDGFVGGHDYVVARRFDNGGKNYLTQKERDEAFKALKNGYEHNFIWDCEASGGAGGRPLLDPNIVGRTRRLWRNIDERR